MKKPLLDILNNEQPSIGGNGANLLLYLEPINSDRINERIGKEKRVWQDGPLIKTSGQPYRMKDGIVTGGRFLFVASDGDIVGGLNYTKMGRDVRVSNIFVRPDYRRKGIATKLIDCAKMDFKRLTVDSKMTDMGAKLFGYADRELSNEGPQP